MSLSSVQRGCRSNQTEFDCLKALRLEEVTNREAVRKMQFLQLSVLRSLKMKQLPRTMERNSH